MAGHFETLAGIRYFVAVNAKNGKILIDIVADEEITAIRREAYRLRQSANLDVVQSGYLIAVHLQDRHRAMRVIVEILLAMVGTERNGSCRQIAFWAERQSFRAVRHRHMI